MSLLRWLKKIVPWKTLLLLAAVVGIGWGGVYLWGSYHHHAALQAVEDDDFDKARDHVEWCLWVWPRSPSLHLLAARIERYRFNLAVAEEHLNRCTELQGGPSESTQFEWLYLRAQRGEFTELESDFWKMAVMNPVRSPDLLEVLALGYMREGRHDMAIMVLSKLLANDPNNVRALTMRALSMQNKGRPEIAVEDLRRVVELAPHRWGVRLSLADGLLDQADPLEARPHLEKLRKERAEDERVLTVYARLLFMEGQSEEARRLVEAVLERNAENYSAVQLRARMALAEEEPQEAEKWFRKVLQMNPRSQDGYTGLCQALERQPGKKKEADRHRKIGEHMRSMAKRLETLLDAAHKAPKSPEAAYELGKMLMDVGEENQALRWLDTALKLNPAHREAHLQLMEYFEKKGFPERAKLHKQKADLLD
jgi:tetratricopeptide (TPR) repeat protein